MPRLTEAQAKILSVGTVLYHHIQKNADRSPLRARISGRCKVWKRPRAPQWQLPMKYGIKSSFYINETTVDDWFTVEDEAKLFHLGYVIHPMTVGFGNDVGYWFITCGNRHLPDHFASFEEALFWGMNNLKGVK